jgi:hypothetical protein
MQHDRATLSLGAAEGVPLSTEDADALLEWVYVDNAKRVDAEAAPIVLPLAAQHSMARLASHCERVMVQAYDLDNLSSAMGMWFYSHSLGSTGARLARIALLAIRESAMPGEVGASTAQQFVDDSEVSQDVATALLAAI